MLLDALVTGISMHQERELKTEEKRWSKIDVPLTLSEGLAKLTKNDLSSIRSNLGIKGASALKKQDLIDALVQEFPAALPRIFNKLDETQYKIIKRIVAQGGHAFVPLESQQLGYFIDRGIIFPGTYDKQKTLVIPEEVAACFKEMEGEAFSETVRRNTEWIKLTQGVLFYYGALSLHELENIIAYYTGTKPELKDYLDVICDAAMFYKEIRMDHSGFSNSEVSNAGEIIKENNSNVTLPFYLFTKDQILTAGEPGFVDRNPSYQALVRYIESNYDISHDEADILAEGCVHSIRAGKSPNQLLLFLQNHLEINTVEAIRGFMDHIVQLHNNTRQWVIKGHTPQELSAERNKAALSMPSAIANVVDLATRKNVGRNEPCPCGSNKKFKKCCGK